MNWTNRKKRELISKVFFFFSFWKLEKWKSRTVNVFMVIFFFLRDPFGYLHFGDKKTFKWRKIDKVKNLTGKETIKKNFTPWEAEAANEIPISTTSTTWKVDRMDSDFGFEIWVFVFISNSEKKKHTHNQKSDRSVADKSVESIFQQSALRIIS